MYRRVLGALRCLVKCSVCLEVRLLQMRDLAALNAFLLYIIGGRSPHVAEHVYFSTIHNPARSADDFAKTGSAAKLRMLFLRDLPGRGRPNHTDVICDLDTVGRFKSPRWFA